MSRVIETKTARLHLLESGVGEPAIIFLHYRGGSARTWHRVIQELGHHVHVLVGHSMGGMVAQLFALRQPSGLAGLALVAPAPPTPMLNGVGDLSPLESPGEIARACLDVLQL